MTFRTLRWRSVSVGAASVPLVEVPTESSVRTGRSAETELSSARGFCPPWFSSGTSGLLGGRCPRLWTVGLLCRRCPFRVVEGGGVTRPTPALYRSETQSTLVLAQGNIKQTFEMVLKNFPECGSNR